MSLRTIHVKKKQYYIGPGDTGGNHTPFFETSPGIISSTPLNYLPTNEFGQCVGYIIAASRPSYSIPPNSDWEADNLATTHPSERVFFNSSDKLRFSLVQSFFKTTLQGNTLESLDTVGRFRNQDWWKKSWTHEDPFATDLVSNYEYFLGNLLNYIDINFPKEMTEMTLVIWMNQLDGSVHIPFLFEGAVHPQYTREFKTYTR